eukprot:1161984-Pelagomonas_calceolata.AAC.5
MPCMCAPHAPSECVPHAQLGEAGECVSAFVFARHTLDVRTSSPEFMCVCMCMCVRACVCARVRCQGQQRSSPLVTYRGQKCALDPERRVVFLDTTGVVSCVERKEDGAVSNPGEE